MQYRFDRSFLFMTLLGFVTLLCACDEQREPKTGSVKADAAAVKKAPSPKPSVLKSAKLNRKLAEKIKAVLGKCSVDDHSGDIKGCEPPSVGQELGLTERAIGAEQAVLSYCHTLSDKYFKRLRALACRRISSIGTPEAMRGVSEKAYRCLFEAFKLSENLYEMNVLIRVATYIAAALGKESELVEHVSKLKPNLPVVVVHNVLWPNARLRVLPRLKALAASSSKKDAMMLAPLVRGMARLSPKTTEEITQVCVALLPLLGHKELTVASAAAHRLAISCDAKARDHVLAEASRRVSAGQVDSNLISTLGGWGIPADKAYSTAQRRKAIKLLGEVLTNNKLKADRRGSALKSIYRLDPMTARRLARRHLKSTEQPLREAAEHILKPRKPTKRKPSGPAKR